MSARDKESFAFRAKVYVRTSRWLRRGVQAYRHDALWTDGRVDLDINLGKVMYRSGPADCEITKKAVHTACSDVGVGPWIEYGSGALVPGPSWPLLANSSRPARPKFAPEPGRFGASVKDLNCMSHNSLGPRGPGPSRSRALRAVGVRRHAAHDRCSLPPEPPSSNGDGAGRPTRREDDFLPPRGDSGTGTLAGSGHGPDMLTG
jgi:hypothetical protein